MDRRIRVSLIVFGKMNDIAMDLLLSLKSNLYNQCVLPVAAHGCETSRKLYGEENYTNYT